MKVRFLRLFWKHATIYLPYTRGLVGKPARQGFSNVTFFWLSCDINAFLRMSGSYIIFHGFFSFFDISVGIKISLEWCILKKFYRLV